MEPPIRTYSEFWPWYLSEHSKKNTRRLHVLGTLISVGVLCLGIVKLSPLYVALALPCGYGPAWLSHFFIEKNRPASFKYPLWSLASDFRMAYWMIRGKI